MVPETLPPYRAISSRPISLNTASTLLSTYLMHSELHPHLHPDALITPAGVTFSSHGGPAGGVIMHNLRRVAAGLRGEYLEPEATPEPEDEGDAQTNSKGGAGKERRGKKGHKPTNAGAENGGVEQEEWQDMSEFERQVDGVEVGEIGPRDTFVAAGGEVPEIHVDGEDDGKKRKKGAEEGGKKDKDARKKAKKERLKEMRREKEMKRAKNED